MNGARVDAPNPCSATQDWSVTFDGRPYIAPERRASSIRDDPMPLGTLAAEITYVAGKFYSGFLARRIPIRKISQICAAAYRAIPGGFDIPPRSQETHPGGTKSTDLLVR